MADVHGQTEPAHMLSTACAAAISRPLAEGARPERRDGGEVR